MCRHTRGRRTATLPDVVIAIDDSRSVGKLLGLGKKDVQTSHKKFEEDSGRLCERIHKFMKRWSKKDREGNIVAIVNKASLRQRDESGLSSHVRAYYAYKKVEDRMQQNSYQTWFVMRPTCIEL